MGILRKPQHKKIIKGIYPPATIGNESNLKPYNLSSVTSYSIRNPNKLPLIAAYMERRVRKDLKRNKMSYVILMVEGLEKIIEATHSELELYEASVRNIIKLLINEEKSVKLRCCGSNLLGTYASFTEQEFATSESDKLLIFLGSVLTLCEVDGGENKNIIDPELDTLRIHGLRSLNNLVLNLGKPSLERNMHLIVPTILGNYHRILKLSAASQSQPASNLIIQEKLLEISKRCLSNLASAVNPGTVNLIMNPVFSYLDGHGWEPVTFINQCVKILIGATQVQSSYFLPLYLHLLRYLKILFTLGMSDNNHNNTNSPLKSKVSNSSLTSTPALLEQGNLLVENKVVSMLERVTRVVSLLKFMMKFNHDNAGSWMHEILYILLECLILTCIDNDDETGDDYLPMMRLTRGEKKEIRVGLIECCNIYAHSMPYVNQAIDVLVYIANYTHSHTNMSYALSNRELDQYNRSIFLIIKTTASLKLRDLPDFSIFPDNLIMGIMHSGLSPNSISSKIDMFEVLSQLILPVSTTIIDLIKQSDASMASDHRRRSSINPNSCILESDRLSSETHKAIHSAIYHCLKKIKWNEIMLLPNNIETYDDSVAIEDGQVSPILHLLVALFHVIHALLHSGGHLEILTLFPMLRSIHSHFHALKEDKETKDGEENEINLSILDYFVCSCLMSVAFLANLSSVSMYLMEKMLRITNKYDNNNDIDSKNYFPLVLYKDKYGLKLIINEAYVTSLRDESSRTNSSNSNSNNRICSNQVSHSLLFDHFKRQTKATSSADDLNSKIFHLSKSFDERDVVDKTTSNNSNNNNILSTITTNNGDGDTATAAVKNEVNSINSDLNIERVIDLMNGNMELLYLLEECCLHTNTIATAIDSTTATAGTAGIIESRVLVRAALVSEYEPIDVNRWKEVVIEKNPGILETNNNDDNIININLDHESDRGGIQSVSISLRENSLSEFETITNSIDDVVMSISDDPDRVSSYEEILEANALKVQRADTEFNNIMMNLLSGDNAEEDDYYGL